MGSNRILGAFGRIFWRTLVRGSWGRLSAWCGTRIRVLGRYCGLVPCVALCAHERGEIPVSEEHAPGSARTDSRIRNPFGSVLSNTRALILGCGWRIRDCCYGRTLCACRVPCLDLLSIALTHCVP